MGQFEFTGITRRRFRNRFRSSVDVAKLPTTQMSIGDYFCFGAGCFADDAFEAAPIR